MSVNIYYDDLMNKEKEALKQIDKAMKVLSKRHWFFMSEDGLRIMRYGEDNCHEIMGSGGVDQEYISASIDGYDTDGGGW